jgi:hypothetical protein
MTLSALGIFSAAGAGPIGPVVLPSDYELIATASGGSSAITFSSIPSDFRDLHLIASLRVNDTNQGVFVRLNGITTNTYHNAGYRAFGATLGIEGSVGFSRFEAQAAVSSAAANYFAGLLINIPDYTNTTKNKIVDLMYTTAFDASTDGWYLPGVLATTNSITSISFTAAAGSFVAASSVSLYGTRV